MNVADASPRCSSRNLDPVALEGGVHPMNALIAPATVLLEPVRVQLPSQRQILAVLEVQLQDRVELGVV